MIKLGIDRLASHASLFEGQRIGLLTNATGMTSCYTSSVDLLKKHYNLVKLFAPEHGVRGDLQAGVGVGGYVDEATGLPVVSLYGQGYRPTPEHMAEIDIFAFDIQNVGSRFYTYLYSLGYIMEACAAAGKKCVVFDRPNPIGASTVEGNILDTEYKSFIGRYPIPQRYGLTIGECALLFNAEYDLGCDLTVVPMEGYRRDMYFEDTGLTWVLPSPNLPTVDSCFAFNATCIFEGTNVSEGRGTTKPFNFVGAPYINGAKLAERLNNLALPGVMFRPQYFTPTHYHPTDAKHPGALCGGVELHVNCRDSFMPVKTGTTMLYTIREMYPDQFKFNPPYHAKGKPMIDYNTGNCYVREGLALDKLLEIFDEDSKKFAQLKAKYHLYS